MNIIEITLRQDPNIQVLGGLKLINHPVILKEKDTPLAMATDDSSIVMIYAAVVHLKWVQFGGTPEQIEQALKDRWEAMEDTFKIIEGGPALEVQRVLFRDADDPLLMCMVVYPQAVDST